MVTVSSVLRLFCVRRWIRRRPPPFQSGIFSLPVISENHQSTPCVRFQLKKRGACAGVADGGAAAQRQQVLVGVPCWNRVQAPPYCQRRSFLPQRTHNCAAYRALGPPPPPAAPPTVSPGSGSGRLSHGQPPPLRPAWRVQWVFNATNEEWDVPAAAAVHMVLLLSPEARSETPSQGPRHFSRITSFDPFHSTPIASLYSVPHTLFIPAFVCAPTLAATIHANPTCLAAASSSFWRPYA